MEPAAAVNIWQRTLSYETPLQFTSFLSDGDSKAYTAVCEANVYCDTHIDKEECTNHVAKRLGTALRKLATPLPRGEKLKDATIMKLQTYYKIAITSNKDSVRIWSEWFKFKHPAQNSAPVPSCDVPHAIKCIRNHLLKHEYGQAGEHRINFSHYKVLFETEKTKHLKVVPKLTEAHVQPSNLQKMNVRLATQVIKDFLNILNETERNHRQKNMILFASRQTM
ncbi:hypothetical protein HPB49_022591 [Dermacentor silvarum]|uniref:Uncharacterized protein n=1 Tax=Dermacentor silvarum TaxID=543639 RepID=A0ACB8D096_DERSI|nr:hypothetical protein HPB49_022591 [Dermacentor silvarum]